MEELQSCTCLFTLLSLFFAWCLTRILKSGGGKRNLPPSPPQLPVIGNLHQVGQLPHRSLGNLSKTYGPLMLLHFSSLPTLIVSSADAAEEVLKTHDLACAGRPALSVLMKVFYDSQDLINRPYGDEWRKLRSIFVQELLSSKRVKSYNSMMEEEIALLVKKVEDCSAAFRPVNLTNMFAELTFDLISRAAFGEKHSESEHGKKFLEAIDKGVGLLWTFTVGEFIPWLSWMGRVSGFNAALDRVVKDRDEILDAFVEDHLNRKLESWSEDEVSGERVENFLDILIRFYKDSRSHASIDLITVKGAILDVFAAGTETSSTILTWIMTELIRHPGVMQKLQAEIREIMKGKKRITDIDLQKMHYMKAMIKETFRFHPPLATYSRASREHVKLMGYDIAPDTMIMINSWAIGRDPACWDEPEKFMPERFLNSSVDFKGFDFKLIPFGAGRRICPGLGFADATIELTVANLMHKFDWALPDGTRGEELDVTERPGFTVGKKYPLTVVATINSKE